MPQAGGCAGTGHTGEGQAADPRSDPARWSARDPHARQRAAEDDPAGDHGDPCPGQPDLHRRIPHLRALAGLGLPAQDGLPQPRRVCPRRGRRRLLRGARQYDGGCLVIAPLLAASASRHLAGEAANLYYLRRLDHADAAETGTSGSRVENLAEKIAAVRGRRDRWQEMLAELDRTGESQISLTDPTAERWRPTRVLRSAPTCRSPS